MECKRCGGQATVDDSICPTCGRLNEKSTAVQQSPEITRAQVMTVVLRQAQSNPNWRQLCDLAMQVNNITDIDVTSEAGLRQITILPPPKNAPPPPLSPDSEWIAGASESSIKLKNLGRSGAGSAVEKLKALHARIGALGQQTDATADSLRQQISTVGTDLESCIVSVQQELTSAARFDQWTAGTERELNRTTAQPLKAPDKRDDPHRIDF